MTSRWEVEKAVLWSELDPPARLIVLALLSKADNDTAVVPAEHGPSLSTLQSMTGLARSAVTEWLNALEDAGWVKRVRRLRGRDSDRTTYALLVGAQTAAKRGRAPKPSPPRGRGPQGGLGGSPQQGLGVVREADEPSPPGGHATTKNPPPKPLPREDVERLCEHLADRIERNGSKRPTITKAWRDAARRLMDIDGRTEDQIHKCIDWCQDDGFWHRNVLSMPKLRDKYDQLRLAAKPAAGGRSGHRPYTNPADVSAYHGEL